MSSEKIVMIEDEEEMVRLLKIELSSEGYDVSTAYGGKVGLELIQQTKPVLVILDVMLPEMDGFDLLKKIKTDPATKDIPVFMLTAKGLDEDIQRGLSLGADDYISKPFHPDLLLKRIKNFLDFTGRNKRNL